MWREKEAIKASEAKKKDKDKEKETDKEKEKEKESEAGKKGDIEGKDNPPANGTIHKK